MRSMLSESAQFVHQCHVIGLEHECFHSQYLNCGYLWTTGKWSETGSAGQPWWDMCWTLASGRWTGFATETQKRQPPPKKTGGKINMDSWLTSAPVISALFLNQAVLRSLSHWSHLLLQAEALSPSRVWNLNAGRRFGFSAVDQTFTYTHQWDTPTPVTPPPHTCNGRERLPSDERLSPWEVKLDSDSGLNWFRMTK